MARRALTIMILGLSLAGCSLFGPPAGRIHRWFPSPEPGTVYEYTITSSWADFTSSTELRHYVVERVEDQEDGSTLIKLANEERLTSLYWILDRANDAVYESNDPTIDETDLLVLLAPVEEDAMWSSGPETAERDYEITDIRSTWTTNIGPVNDLVEVTFDLDSEPGVEFAVEWAPDVGIVTYEEDYGNTGSFLASYRRELTGLTAPE
jgi:hypothetical protein